MKKRITNHTEKPFPQYANIIGDLKNCYKKPVSGVQL